MTKKTLKELYGDTVNVTIIDQQGFERPGIIAVDKIVAWYSLITPNGATHVIDTTVMGLNFRVTSPPPMQVEPVKVPNAPAGRTVAEEAPA